MNLQRDNIITKQILERHIEEEDNPWTLGNLMKTSRMGSPSASITTSTAIWQKNADWKRRNKKHKCVLNTIRRDILLKIVKGNRQ